MNSIYFKATIGSFLAISLIVAALYYGVINP